MPRKTVVDVQALRLCRGASMRPRPDAAENDANRARTRWPHVASMRPRPDAAENLGTLYPRVVRKSWLQ